MPMVGNKEFDYTPRGRAMAMAESKKTGKPMKKAVKKTAKRVAKKSSMVRKRGM
jgi:hypothetical protein